jgi:hypothetical protein
MIGVANDRANLDCPSLHSRSVDLSQHLVGLLMEKAHQMLDLAAEFERRAKTPTNGATTQEFLLAAAALRLAAQADAPVGRDHFIAEAIAEADAPTIDNTPSCGQENDYRRAQPQRPTLPDRERMAEILYTAAHKGLRNCWKWSDAGLDHEHPTSRGYWYKVADGALAALSVTRPDRNSEAG